MISGREELPVSRDVLVCRQILRIIKRNMHRVRVPYANDIRFVSGASRRDMVMFYDFLQASAVLHNRQRMTTREEGVMLVDANPNDFKIAAGIYQASADTRLFRLTKEERALVDWITSRMKLEGITESTIIEDYGKSRSLSRSKLRRLLYGPNGDGGLLAKVPGMHVQRTTTRQNEEKTVTQNVIFCPVDAKSTLDSYGDFVIYSGDTDPDSGIEGVDQLTSA